MVEDANGGEPGVVTIWKVDVLLCHEWGAVGEVTTGDRADKEDLRDGLEPQMKVSV